MDQQPCRLEILLIHLSLKDGDRIRTLEQSLPKTAIHLLRLMYPFEPITFQPFRPREEANIQSARTPQFILTVSNKQHFGITNSHDLLRRDMTTPLDTIQPHVTYARW